DRGYPVPRRRHGRPHPHAHQARPRLAAPGVGRADRPRPRPEVLRNVTRVERMTDGPYAVGTRWRETRRMMGREETEEMWVAESDPLRRTVVAASSGGAEYRTTFELEPQPDG